MVYSQAITQQASISHYKPIIYQLLAKPCQCFSQPNPRNLYVSNGFFFRPSFRRRRREGRQAKLRRGEL